MKRYKSSTFVCQTDAATQAAIFADLATALEFVHGCPTDELADAIDDAMCVRLCELDEVINVDPYVVW